MKRILTIFEPVRISVFTLILLMLPSVSYGQRAAWYSNINDNSRGAFGPDTRAEAKSKWEYRDYMRATATAVQKKNVSGDKIHAADLKTYLISVFGNFPLDKGIRFPNQPTAGFCTGFLIAPDILVTAGHCIKTQEDLENTVWIFDYTADVQYNQPEEYVLIPQDNQYYGVEILDTRLSSDRKYDYCVIRLNRKTNRKPFKFRTGGAIEFNDIIAMIGSPGGIPLKLADSARATNTEDYATSFLTDLDAFHGNSGGPVFNLLGFIEGILVRGPGNDYHFDETCGCIKADSRMDLYYYFGMQAKTGNAVHRITHIPFNLLVQSIYRNIEVAAESDNFEEFREWLIYSWIWKKENAIEDKERLLTLLARFQRENFLTYVIGTENVDVNTVSLDGTPLIVLLSRMHLNKALKKALNQENCDINACDKNGNTALMEAARLGNREALEILLEKNVNPFITNSVGLTAKMLAKQSRQKDIYKVLKKYEKLKK